MTRDEIRQVYHQISKDFACLPFDQVLEYCRKMVKKYYSCYPLLFHIGSLLINHHMLAENQEKAKQTLEEARRLFVRTKNETDDPILGKEALQMEAYCLLALKRPAEVLDLLQKAQPTLNSIEPLLSSAYQATGNIREAKRILQAGIYKNIVNLVNLLLSYLGLNSDALDVFEETCARLQGIAEIFHLKTLHPTILLSCYLTMAQGFVCLGKQEKALQFLIKYTNLATGDIYPIRLHGDDYFDLLDDWIKHDLDLGDLIPRNEALVRHSMTLALEDNPAFSVFTEDPRFQGMLKRLKNNEEGNQPCKL
nr:transcriptional regulator [uncultured Solibaculum sp.]